MSKFKQYLEGIQTGSSVMKKSYSSQDSEFGKENKIDQMINDEKKSLEEGLKKMIRDLEDSEIELFDIFDDWQFLLDEKESDGEKLNSNQLQKVNKVLKTTERVNVSIDNLIEEIYKTLDNLKKI